GMVAELRRTAADEACSPALRAAAAERLARLASATHRGAPVAPQADPAHWWGTRVRTVSLQPLRAPDEPLAISASVLDSLLTCPARWFLEQEAGGLQET